MIGPVAKTGVDFFLLSPREEMNPHFVLHTHNYLPPYIVFPEYHLYFETKEKYMFPIEGFNIILSLSDHNKLISLNDGRVLFI